MRLPGHTLEAASLDRILAALTPALSAFDAAYPGERSERQPVHTVYGGADLFRSDTGIRLGSTALRSLEAYAPSALAFATAIGLERESSDLTDLVYDRVVEKLRREPVEDFRIDFEDGFGQRPDDEEDYHAVRAAREVATGLADGTLPPFIGLRIKPFSDAFSHRAARTFDLFLTTLLEATSGSLPPGFVVTNPKVVVPEQVAALADLFDEIESQTDLSRGSLQMEIMIETPQSILAPDGRSALSRLISAGRGRCVAAHFGVYDYTASVQITAHHQHLDHPACDFARHMMQVALSGTGIWLSDGATNVLPARIHRPVEGQELSPEQEAENRDAVHAAWRLHFEHVQHSLRHAYFQGWDLHPAQLPTRYAALYMFFLAERDNAVDRLRGFVDQAGRATLTGDVFDDAATGQALLNFFLRGLNCGAFDDADVAATGLTQAEIESRSFSRIVEARQG